MSLTHVNFGNLPGINSNRHASAPFDRGTYTVFLSNDGIVVGILNENGPTAFKRVSTSCSQLTRTEFLPLLYILNTYFLPSSLSQY